MDLIVDARACYVYVFCSRPGAEKPGSLGTGLAQHARRADLSLDLRPYVNETSSLGSGLGLIKLTAASFGRGLADWVRFNYRKVGLEWIDGRAWPGLCASVVA